MHLKEEGFSLAGQSLKYQLLLSVLHAQLIISFLLRLSGEGGIDSLRAQGLGWEVSHCLPRHTQPLLAPAHSTLGNIWTLYFTESRNIWKGPSKAIECVSTVQTELSGSSQPFNTAASIPQSLLHMSSRLFLPWCPASASPQVLTVLRLIFVGRAELLDDLLLLGLHHGRVAFSQLAEESWTLSVVSWGLGPHPAEQNITGNLCNIHCTKSSSLRVTAEDQLLASSASPTSLPIPTINTVLNSCDKYPGMGQGSKESSPAQAMCGAMPIPRCPQAVPLVHGLSLSEQDGVRGALGVLCFSHAVWWRHGLDTAVRAPRRRLALLRGPDSKGTMPSGHCDSPCPRAGQGEKDSCCCSAWFGQRAELSHPKHSPGGTCWWQGHRDPCDLLGTLSVFVNTAEAEPATSHCPCQGHTAAGWLQEGTGAGAAWGGITAGP